MENVLLFILVLHPCADSSIVFHLTQISFLKLECYTQLRNRISDVMDQKNSFGNTMENVTYMSMLLGL